MHFVKEIILYGKGVILRIGCSGVTTTTYSKLITKIAFLIIIAYFIGSLIQIFERKNLISNTTTRKTYPRQHIPINSNNFQFAFAVYDNNSSIITQSELEKYYVPYFYMVTLENYNKTFNYSIIRNCTSSDFVNLNDQDYIFYNNLINYSCIDNFNSK